MKKLLFLLLLPVITHAQLVPGILRDASYAEPPDSGAGAWSYVALGTGVCTSVTDSSGTLTIEASGPDIDNGCFVYQTLNTATAQVYGRIASITGTAAATTKVGAQIANSATDLASHCMVWWNAVAGGTRGTTRAADGQSSVGGITGNATTLATHVGASFTDSTDLCKLYDYDTATAPADPTTDFAGVPQPHQSYSVDAAAPFAVGFFMHSGHASNTATVTITDYEVQETIDLADNGADPDANLIFRSDFESGTVTHDTGADTDDWLIQTMRQKCDVPAVACPDPDLRCWRTQGTITGSCTGRTHAYSDEVVTSDGSITPRAGNYMMRLEVRDQDCAVGVPPCEASNERSNFKISKTSPQPGAITDVDGTHYWAVSVYLPSAENSPTFSEYLMQCSINPDPSPVSQIAFTHVLVQKDGPTTNPSMRWQVYEYNGGDRTRVIDPELNAANLDDFHFDEWYDYRYEMNIGYADGVVKVWRRRAEVTNDWTLVVDYSGEAFKEGSGLVCSFSIYGGGGFPLIGYFDEFKITNAATGSLADVSPPDIASAP